MSIPPDASAVAPSVDSLCFRIGTGLKAEVVAVESVDGSTCRLLMAGSKLSVNLIVVIYCVFESFEDKAA